MKIKDLKVPPPGPEYEYAFGHDLVGNAFVAFRTRGHIDYIYGMFKGRELTGGHLDAIESWHKDGDELAFEDHPIKGNVVLVLKDARVREIFGPEADAIVAREKAKAAEEEKAEAKP